MHENAQHISEAAYGFCRRLGKSPFWLSAELEQYAAAGSASWRLGISQRPASRRKLAERLPLVDISPRRPLLTLLAQGESFPLLIAKCEDVRGGVILSGSRRMMLKATHTVEWTARVRTETSRTGAHLRVEFKAAVNPPLPAGKPADLRIEVSAAMLRPEPWWFPYAPESHRGAAVLWGEQSGVTASIATPGATDCASGVAVDSDKSASVVHTIPNVVRRSRGSYAFSLRFDIARSRSHSQFLHMRHSVAVLPAGLPPAPPPQDTSLRDRAMLALQHLTDKGGYKVAGVERLYMRTGNRQAGDHADLYAGFPYFPVDAARAMLDWHLLIGHDAAARLALLVAPGIATDFTVTGTSTNGINKGAFWDCRHDSPSHRTRPFTDFNGDDFHSVASTSRIARGLLAVHERTHDRLTYNAAIAACQWLILKQNEFGYYDGDRVCASTGAVMAGEETLCGVEAAQALLLAYRQTKNEAFVKASARALRHVATALMPALIASPIYRTRRIPGDDSPASVAAIIRAVALAHAETHSRRTKEELDMAGTWLRAWDLTNLDDPALNDDGHWDGLFEIVRSALQMAAATKDPSWLDMALRVTAAMPQEARDGWQALPLFLETMLGLAALVESARPDLHEYSVRVGWTDYTPDATTNLYISVADADGLYPVDYLPLVSRVDGRVLLLVLAHGPVESVRIHQNSREPNLRDLNTGEIVCPPAPLHKLPFESSCRWGCFTIDP
jgi:hypothetical protein